MNDKAAQTIAMAIASVFIVLVCLGALLALLASNNTDLGKHETRTAEDVAMMAVKREERQAAKPFIVFALGLFAIGSSVCSVLFLGHMAWVMPPAIAESVAPQVAAGQVQQAQLPTVVTEALPAPAGRFREIVTYGGNNDD